MSFSKPLKPEEFFLKRRGEPISFSIAKRQIISHDHSYRKEVVASKSKRKCCAKSCNNTEGSLFTFPPIYKIENGEKIESAENINK